MANSGYGQLSRGGRGNGMVTAHRTSYELFNGPIPEGMCVMHACDVRRCVNPKHLSVGTIGDNNRDMWGKGRGVYTTLRGEQSGASKLTEEAVHQIRSRRAAGEKLAVLAREFGVTDSAVCAVAKGHVWQHVP